MTEEKNYTPDSPEAIVDEEIVDVTTSTRSYWKKHRRHLFFVLFGTIAIEVVLFLFMGASGGFIYIFPIMWPIIEYSSVSSKIQDEFIAQFAAANGYAFAATGPFGTGRFFKLGHDRRASNIVTGMEKECPIQFYTYSYAIGYGKQRHEYSFTVFSIMFDTVMPEILLLSKDHVLGEGPVLEGTSVVKLEGDFDKHFSLHVPPGYEIEALEIFTPDVMAELIDKGCWYSLEISKRYLYLYVEYQMESKKDLNAMQDFARYFLDHVGPVLAQMKPSLDSTVAENTVLNAK